MADDADRIPLEGLAWYRPGDWMRLKRIVADPEVVDSSYANWKRKALRAMTAMRADGHLCLKVVIDLDELSEWCEEQGIPNNTKARSQFAAYKLSEMTKFEDLAEEGQGEGGAE